MSPITAQCPSFPGFPFLTKKNTFRRLEAYNPQAEKGIIAPAGWRSFHPASRIKYRMWCGVACAPARACSPAPYHVGSEAPVLSSAGPSYRLFLLLFPPLLLAG